MSKTSDITIKIQIENFDQIMESINALTAAVASAVGVSATVINNYSEPATAENAPEKPNTPSDDVKGYLPEQAADPAPVPTSKGINLDDLPPYDDEPKPKAKKAVKAAEAPAPVPTAVPTAAAPTYTFDDLSNAARLVAEVKGLKVVQDLNAEFGLQKLSDLAPERYGDYAAKLRELGAQI